MRAKELIRPMKIHLSTDPSNIHPDVMVELIGLIQDSGEVSMDKIHRNIVNADAVSWVSDDGQPVGVLVLKNPLKSYKYKVFDAAGLPEEADDFNVELGYLYVKPEFRGQGKAKDLVQTLISKTDKRIYATTREVNHVANDMLSKMNFKNIGNPYQSSRGNYNLLLWVK